MKPKLIVFLLFLPLYSALAYDLEDFPDHSGVRSAETALIGGSLQDWRRETGRVVTQIGGRDVRIETRSTADSMYLLFIPLQAGVFSPDNQGSYIIKRSTVDATLLQVKIFLSPYGSAYIRLYPQGDRTRLDLFLFDKPLYQNIMLPFTFRQSLVLPFQSLITSTQSIIPWGEFIPALDEPGYDRLQAMSEQIRLVLPELGDADDGALDGDGRFVMIEDLSPQADPPGFNCSGFAEWVADPIALERLGQYFSVAQLKKKPVDARGNRWANVYEELRDPWFGLDWTRNIASSLLTYGDIRRGSGYEAADVVSVPFDSYIEDVGYPLSDLQRILYYLSVTEPGYFYLASINVPYGTAPILRQHVHVAVIIPYFSKTGGFIADIYERSTENSLAAMASRYKDAYVHLVRISAPEHYVPRDVPVSGMD